MIPSTQERCCAAGLKVEGKNHTHSAGKRTSSISVCFRLTLQGSEAKLSTKASFVIPSTADLNDALGTFRSTSWKALKTASGAHAHEKEKLDLLLVIWNGSWTQRSSSPCYFFSSFFLLGTAATRIRYLSLTYPGRLVNKAMPEPTCYTMANRWKCFF